MNENNTIATVEAVLLDHKNTTVEAVLPNHIIYAIGREEYEKNTTKHGSLTTEIKDISIDLLESNLNNEIHKVTLHAATESQIGLMSSNDKKKLNKLYQNVSWNNHIAPYSNMNDFTTYGVYHLYGSRTRNNDNLPIANTGGGHTFDAILTVLDSSISDTTNSDDKCITQLLNFNNRLGQGEVYIRTGKGKTIDSLTWDAWSTLQRNVNVGQVDNLDNFIDNGIYSGVYKHGSLLNIETFVMVVLNDYAVVSQMVGVNRSVSQFKYSYNTVTKETTFRHRTLSSDGWSDWKNIGDNYTLPIATSDVLGGIKSATSRPIGSDISEGRKCDVYVDGNSGLAHVVVAPASNSSYGVVKVDSVVSDYSSNPVSSKAVADVINNLFTLIIQETTRAKGSEQALDDKINDEIERAKAAEKSIDDKVVAIDGMDVLHQSDCVDIEFDTLGERRNNITINASTEDTAGVMSAEDKKKLNGLPEGDDILIDDYVIATPTEEVINDIEPTLVSTALRKTPQVLTETEKKIARGNIGAADAEQTSLSISANETALSNEVNRAKQAEVDAIEKGRQLALRTLFIAAGAEYNDTDQVIKKTAFWGEEVDHLPHHYYLNGLGDITEEEMVEIYDYKDVIGMIMSGIKYIRVLQDVKNPRTLLAPKGYRFGQNNELNGYGYFFGNGIEVIKFYNKDVWKPLEGLIKISVDFIYSSNTLRVVDTFKQSSVETMGNTPNLTHIRAVLIKSFNLSLNPLLSKDSIIFMIENFVVPSSSATTSTPYTITLHPNVYAKCIEGGEWYEDVNTALDTKNNALSAKNYSLNIVTI